jgi:hypothetical protein
MLFDHSFEHIIRTCLSRQQGKNEILCSVKYGTLSVSSLLPIESMHRYKSPHNVINLPVYNKPRFDGSTPEDRDLGRIVGYNFIAHLYTEVTDFPLYIFLFSF